MRGDGNFGLLTPYTLTLTRAEVKGIYETKSLRTVNSI